MKKYYFISVFILFFLFGFYGCCKKNNDCVSSSLKVIPFTERFNYFNCNDSSEKTYVFRKKAQIDSLSPQCEIYFPVPFPIDEIDMAYIIFGKMSYYRKDTFETALYKDTCNKKLTYDVTMIQRTDSSLGSFAWPLYMFCSVENIPADYQVEVKYKYVPIQ